MNQRLKFVSSLAMSYLALKSSIVLFQGEYVAIYDKKNAKFVATYGPGLSIHFYIPYVQDAIKFDLNTQVKSIKMKVKSLEQKVLILSVQLEYKIVVLDQNESEQQNQQEDFSKIQQMIFNLKGDQNIEVLVRFIANEQFSQVLSNYSLKEIEVNNQSYVKQIEENLHSALNPFYIKLEKLELTSIEEID